MPMSRLYSAVQVEYEEYGLALPAQDKEYFSSVFGSVFRGLKSRVRVPFGVSHGLIWLDHVKVEFADQPGHFVIEARGTLIRCKWLLMKNTRKTEWTRELAKLPPKQITTTLLTSIVGGTSLWRHRASGIDDYEWFLVGAKSRPVPTISFDLPATSRELNEYERWLVQIVGSKNRFRDGWGKMVKLQLLTGGKAATLVVSSAGQDGMWGTNDDMIIKRETKNGKVLEKIGLSERNTESCREQAAKNSSADE